MLLLLPAATADADGGKRMEEAKDATTRKRERIEEQEERRLLPLFYRQLFSQCLSLPRSSERSLFLFHPSRSPSFSSLPRLIPVQTYPPSLLLQAIEKRKERENRQAITLSLSLLSHPLDPQGKAKARTW